MTLYKTVYTMKPFNKYILQFLNFFLSVEYNIISHNNYNL